MVQRTLDGALLHQNHLDTFLWIYSAILILVGSVDTQSICEGHKTIISTLLQGTITNGPSAYIANQRCEWLILSPDAVKYPFISLEFLSKDTECAYDYIMIHDGDSYDSPLLATLSGGSTTIKGSPLSIMAHSGKMLVYLFSDGNTEFAGFNASFIISECPNNCTGNGNCVNNRCHCDTPWTGNDCSGHACPHNCGRNGRCRTAANVKKCGCNDGYIGRGCLMNVNSDGEGYWTVVYDHQDEPGSIGRAGHTGIYVDSYFYIFGGFDMNRPISELLKYNFKANEWLQLQSITQPSARFFHSMTAVDDQHFLLYGGNLGDDHLSNETWLYDTQSNSWSTPSTTHGVVPALCQHTATLVDTNEDRFVFVFGGRTENSHEFGLSSDMYRFEWGRKLWRKVTYDPSGVKSSKLRVAGHSIVYDAVDGTLVLFGGLRMDPQHKAVYSSSVFLYSVKENRWAEVVASDQPESSFIYNIEPLAFHTANIVGDYMVVHGGNLFSKSHNLCYSWKTHFYNLRCHAWVRELLRRSKHAPLRLYGHTAAIMNDAVLLLHGGYNGVMSHQLLSYKLPKLSSVTSLEVAKSVCDGHDDRSSCGGNYLHGCVWVSNKCKSGEEYVPVYGSVCQYLKDCLSCTSFQSYIRNASYGWESSHCGWCVQDSTCYAINDKGGLGACDADDGTAKEDQWWEANDTVLLQNPSHCLLHNIQPGIIASEYHHSPNFSQPDNVSHLTEMKLALQGADSDHLVKFRGFLRPANLLGKFMKMQLLSVKGESKIELSLNDSPKDLKEVLKTTENTDLTIPATSELIALRNFHERCYIEVSFHHSDTGRWTGKIEAEMATSSTAKNFKFSTLSASHLEPYQSSVISDASSVPSCDALSNCLACLTDTSCAWCQSRSVCTTKSSLADGSVSCSEKDFKLQSPHFGMITEPGSCVVCQDFSTCGECVSSRSHCEWRKDTDLKVKCVRRGSSGNSTSKSEDCPLPCHERRNCNSCLEETNRHGVSLRCAWCSTTKKCYRFTRYHLAAYPFGQCAFWVDEQRRCPLCSRHDKCESCLQTYECGWCSIDSNPLLGYCTKGEFADSEINCDVNNLPPEHYNGTGDIEWSYDACPDVNECELTEWPVGNSLFSCHPDATCLNTYGSYVCACNDGFHLDGQDCERTCLTECVNGRCSGPPDYTCVCDLGWTSLPLSVDDTRMECDVDCNCSLLSTCNSGRGNCDFCQRNTTGPRCEECLLGYFRAGEMEEGCRPCQCNEHGVNSSGVCDRSTGDCFCGHNTQGRHCESCEIGFFGDPRNGGTCYRKCGGRLKLEDGAGAFGSWESSVRQDGSLLRRESEKISHRISLANCEWTIVPRNNNSGTSAIKITLEKGINVSCYTNKVVVYDGSFDSATMTLIGEFCGSNWTKNEIVYARSGQATIRYTDVYLEHTPRKVGFTALYEVVPFCQDTATITTLSDTETEGDLFSGEPDSTNNSANIDQSMGLTSEEDCLDTFYIRCPGNCSGHLGQGTCKNGQCHCNTNYTGSDCSVLSNGIPSYANVQIEWSKRYDQRPSPGGLIGHVFVSIASFLWLHGGISPGGDVSDELWKYDIHEKEWTFINITELQPDGRYFHAAAKHPDGKKIFMCGGILNGGNASSEIWSFSEDHLWQKINTSLPSVAGHTMTFCSDVVAYIIGGYSSLYGWNKNVWTFNAVTNQVEFIPKSVVRPPMLYYHTTVCDQDTGILYVYGGLEATLLQLPTPTSATYTLNTKTLKWQPVFLNGVHPISPSPRASHTALNYRSGVSYGMLILGGSFRSSRTSDEIWFLSYNCSTWTKLASYVENKSMTLVESLPIYTSLASVSQSHFLYGGLQDGRFLAEMIIISNLDVSLSKVAQSLETCTDRGKPVCSYFKDCKNCLEADSCNWCETGSNLNKGECVPLLSPCGDNKNRVSAENECSACINLPLASCDAIPGCSWKNAEVMDVDHNKLVTSCLCHSEPSKTDHINISPRRQTDEPCPGSCIVHKSCATCLEIPEKLGVWWNCVWSPGLQKCLDPAYVPLVCPPGGDCGVLASKGGASCPVSRCEELISCWKCIHEPQCYWLQMNSSGACQDVSTHQQLLKCVGVWWNCVWSPGLQKCLDPAYVPLVCPPGGDCGMLASKGGASCPVSRCEDLISCWKCIHEPQCYWLQMNSSGACQDVSAHQVSKTSGVEWYYECPPEDECSNHWDDCLDDDANHEKCRDLSQGYECVCEEGYNRTSPNQPCIPVCTEGCFYGRCIEPDVCRCNFGYTGASCNTPCQCNGHSACNDDNGPNICLQCHNHTVGNQCESCRIGFVGDPTKNISCANCKDVCNGKSENCSSKSKSSSNHGPTHDDVKCLKCRNHSRGDRCEKCKDGYFKLKDECKKCECNGHSETCDEDTGGFCKCQNQTTSSDTKCDIPKNSQEPYPADCWKKQCDKCEPSYQGDPQNGSHCFRHVAMEQNMCFSARSPTHCPTETYFGEASRHALSAGETVTFAINPKYTNVDIRIIVDVTYGELSLFLSDRSDSFRIVPDRTQRNSHMHKVITTDTIVRSGRNKRGLPADYLEDDVLQRSQFEEVIRMRRSFNNRVGDIDYSQSIQEEPPLVDRLKFDVVNATEFNSYVMLEPRNALRIDGIKDRLVVTIPHHGFDMKLKKFFVILLGQRTVVRTKGDFTAPVTDTRRDKRSINSVKSTKRQNDKTAGQFVFRQDQTHIDLFVFFSVFFSCFFLFLAICIVAWKVKQAMDVRQARLARSIEMQHMASRPFSSVYVILESCIPEPLFHPTYTLPKAVATRRDATPELFQARSCPVFIHPCANDEGAGTSGSNYFTRRPNSSSLPTTPSRKSNKHCQATGTRTAARLSLDMSSNSSKGDHVSPIISISKAVSQGTTYSSDSTVRLLVVHGSPAGSGNTIPMLNSTTYIKQEPEIENICPLTPLSSCSTPTRDSCSSTARGYFHSHGVATIASLTGSGRIKTFRKRKTLPRGRSETRNSPDGIFEPRTKYRSAPNLSATERTVSSVSGSALPSKSSMEGRQQSEPPVTRKCSPKKISHHRMNVKSRSTPMSDTSKVVRPLACEITENNFASVNTVLLQLPGGSKARVLACLGSALVTTRNACRSSFTHESHKPQHKSRSSKLL